jgi:hypothetical protein
MRSLIVIAAVVMSFGCSTVAVVPQAEHIKTTRNKDEVANCKMLGIVEAHPPYIGSHDAANQLKNRAALLNADTVFVSGVAGTITGVAYKCAATQ